MVLTVDLSVTGTDGVFDFVTEVIAVVSVWAGGVAAGAGVGHPDGGAVVLVGYA